MTDRDLLEQLSALETEGRAEIGRITSTEELEAVRVRFLGRKEGRVTAILRRLGELPPDARPAVGEAANRVKAALLEGLERRRAALDTDGGGAALLDLSLPGRATWRGSAHPIIQVIDEICDVFGSLGFTRARGPEAETEWHNFTALNTPLNHPAADEHDTFYLSAHTVLRSHTSPVQVRTMQEYQPPIRVVIPGMCYRRDPYDASHAPAFDQIEGLAVDEGIDFVDLKATLAEFAHRFFGSSARVRFRPSYFPFTEPSAEVDVSCTICGGSGCSACKGTGWMEIMGAGMVDPAVFENVGYDAERFTGFAFGMGPGRIAQLRYGIPDIRLFYEADVRFLEQFG